MCSMSAGCLNWGRTWGYALPGYVLLIYDLDESGILSRSNGVLVSFEVFCVCDLDESGILFRSNEVLVSFEVFCACVLDGWGNLSWSLLFFDQED